MALLTCPDCGGKVSSRAAACPHCGCPVTVMNKAAADGAVDEKTAALPLEIATPGSITTVALARAVSVGRSHANVLIDHSDVAPLHCQLAPADGAWRMTAVGEAPCFAGGTLVREARLGPGAVIDLGRFPGVIALAMPHTLAQPLGMRLRAHGAPEQAVELRKLPLLIGRAPWIDLPLADPNVSALHARLRLDQGRIVIDDMRSRNGTRINGAPLTRPHPLMPGDTIQLGSTALVFGEAPAPRRPPSTERTPGEVVLPAGLSFDQLMQSPDQHVHVPALRADQTAHVQVHARRCPSCSEPLNLARPGVITGAMRLAHATGGRGKAEPRAELGRCAACGARLALCPECGVANVAPTLFEALSCRRCGEEFTPG